MFNQKKVNSSVWIHDAQQTGVLWRLSFTLFLFFFLSICPANGGRRGDGAINPSEHLSKTRNQSAIVAASTDDAFTQSCDVLLIELGIPVVCAYPVVLSHRSSSAHDPVRIKRNVINPLVTHITQHQSIYYVQKKPRITRPPGSVSTIVGQSALFVCLVEGNPAPKVQWKVSGIVVSESHFGKTIKAPRGSVLRVSNVLPTYNGAIITCSATNALGRAEHSANLVIYPDESAVPQGFPQFVNSFSVIVAKKNGAVELECRTTGDPQPEVTWYMNSVPIDFGNSRFTQLDTGNLRITDLVEDDEGKYECLASNEKGARLSSGDDLLVRENVETSLQLIAPTTRRFRPHFTSVPPPRQIVPPGGRLVLTCTAVGAPVPTVNWFRGSRRLHHEQSDKQPPTTAKILLLDLSESVNVSCVAQSSMGRIYHDVHVVVKNLPNPPGRPQLVDIGSTYAHIAFEPSSEPVESQITHYLVFWIPTAKFDNQTLNAMPTQLNDVLNSGIVGLESSAKTETVQPAYNLIRAELKNVTQSTDGRVTVLDSDKGSKTSGDVKQKVHQAIVTSVTQLKPYTNYTIWARAVGLDNDASVPGMISTFVTQEIAPSTPPRNVNAQAISYAAVTVCWDSPLEPNGKLRAYRVYYTDRPNLELAFWDTNIVDLESTIQQSQPGVDSSSHSGQLHILSHMTANATYFIRVSAVNAKGEGPPSDVAVVIVRPGLLAKPRNFTALSKSSHEIHLAWLPPADVEQPAQPLRQYSLKYAPASPLAKAGDQNNWVTSIESLTTETVQTQLLDAGAKETLVTALAPDTQYVFSLAPLSSAGPGVNAIVYGRTKKYVPPEPTNLVVQAVGPTELDVRWQPPMFAHPDGRKATRIAYYDLSWRPSTSTGGWLQNESGGTAQWTANAVGNLVPDSHGFNRRLVPVHSDSSSADVYTARITGVQPATFYVVQVRAVASSGTGDRALASPVRTWDPPPPAPGNLRLFSQILAPAGPLLPPQVLIKVSWERPSDLEDEAYSPMQFRVRWKLLLSGLNQVDASVLSRRVRAVEQMEPVKDRLLFWPTLGTAGGPQNSEYEILPEQYQSGEVNTTETTWNALPGPFLLGMTYEFRVAVINVNQAGQEAVQLISLEGSAPTSSPINLDTIVKQDSTILSWSPPDWTHRHGPFLAYEVRCEAMNPVGNYFRQINLTIENSKIFWPEQGRLGPQSLIAWPNGKVRLQSPDFGEDLLSRDIECRVRGYTKYGFSPWSQKVDIYAKQKSAVPPPPKHIHAIVLPNGDLLVSWSMPKLLVQTLLPQNEFESVAPTIVYRRFAVYTSPMDTKNWTRHVTNGPVTEFTVPKPVGHPSVQVRVSSIGTGGHEGTWSDAVRAYPSTNAVTVSVENLTCIPVYSNEYSSWALYISWNNPSWLLARSNRERLLHFMVNYTWSTTSADSREVSAAVPGPTVPAAFQHQLHGLRSNTVYTVSVRPVIWFEESQVSSTGIDCYGAQTSVKCSIPKKPFLQVEPPWVIKSPDVGETGEPIVAVGCAVQNSIALDQATQTELVGQRLDRRSDRIVLAKWFPTKFQGSTEKQFVQVNLAGPRVRESVDGKIISGQRLQSGGSYALALRVCAKNLTRPDETAELIDTATTVCVQSSWTKPVGTHLPPALASQAHRPVISDPDRVLWYDEPQADLMTPMNQSPSDDASAHGPNWSSTVHGKRQLESDIMFPGIPFTTESLGSAQLNVPKPNDSRLIKSANLSIMISIVCITLVLLGLGLVFLLFIVYRRKILGPRANGASKPWREEQRRGQPKYSLLNWVKLAKRSPPYSVPNSLILAHIQGPPSGISSIAANLPPVISPYSYFDESADVPTHDSRLNGSVNLLGSTSQFDSLRAEPIVQNYAPLDLTDTPNSTLLTNGLPHGLHRADSMSNRIATSPSPTDTYSIARMTRPLTTDLLSGYSGFNMGSLKSVNTNESRGMLSRNGPACLGLSCVNPINAKFSNAVVSRPIDVNQLIQHVELLKADNGRLMAAEFESIDPGGQFSWEHSNRPANRSKNRYANVIAYDHSRVILQPTSIKDPDSDYINANYLDGYKKLNAYIATQGPLANTINDFWRMVWEQRSAIIVSMTRLEERARVKCEQYWPGSGSSAIGSACAASSSPNRFLTRCGLDSKSATIRDARNNPLIQPVAPFLPNGFSADPAIVDDDSTVLANSMQHHVWQTGDTELLSEASYGDIKIGLVDMIELAYYTIRTFILQKVGSSERREVRQLQFTAWPDHGVPNHPAPLLMFLRRVRAECPPDAGPMIVHCSAGVGRTGAFILLDILLEQMRHERVVDVFGAVSRLRSQRNFMVQTEDQYAFVYEALVEASASGNTELNVRQLAAHWSRLTRPNDNAVESESSPDAIRTGLDLEFSQLVAQSKLTKVVTSAPSNVGLLSPIDPISTHDEDTPNGQTNAPRLPAVGTLSNKGNAATLGVNQWKNRDAAVVPHEANRVALKAIRGVEGSDYVNASYIDGYRSRAAYIATQAPLTSTLDDFWRMIWETGCSLIVRLEGRPAFPDQITHDVPNYWPVSQSARRGFFIVDPISTYTMTSFVMREIRLTDTRDGTTRTVRLFDAAEAIDAMREFSARPAHSPEDRRAHSLLHTSITTSSCRLTGDFKQKYQNLSSVLLDVIIQVHKTKEQFGIDGPIIAHCNLGAGRTGVFLAISLVLERIRHEGVLDMFQTVKLLRWQRPALVRTPAEYAFCYATILEYLESFERYAT